MTRWVLDSIFGFHEIGPFVWILHDRGLTLCWRRVVFWEWKAMLSGRPMAPASEGLQK